MAKKSAYSKGYRKTIKAKPFLTKKEIIELVIIVAVIILAVVLFNIIYDDGFIKANKVQPGDVVSYASSELKDRYKKIAEIGEVEGFTLEDRGENASLTTDYTFNADDEAENTTHMTVRGSFVNAATMVDSNKSFMSSLSDSTVEMTDVLETTIQGYEALVYSYTYSEYVNEEGVTEEAPEGVADNNFNQIISTYVNLNDTHSLSFQIYREGEDDSFYLPEDQLLEFVEKYSTAFTMVPLDA